MDQKLPLFLETKPAFLDFEKQESCVKHKNKNQENPVSFPDETGFFSKKWFVRVNPTNPFLDCKGAQSPTRSASESMCAAMCVCAASACLLMSTRLFVPFGSGRVNETQCDGCYISVVIVTAWARIFRLNFDLKFVCRMSNAHATRMCRMRRTQCTRNTACTRARARPAGGLQRGQ